VPLPHQFARGGLAQSATLRFTFCLESADKTVMPIYGRHFVRGQLQFITTSTYRRARLFPCQRFCRIFVAVLRPLREETGFLLNGWVLMPDHFHLLIRPEPPEATVRFIQEWKKRTAQQIIAALIRHRGNPRCRAWLARLRLPPSVHGDSTYRVWQRRYVPFNVFTHKKQMEKLDYVHHHPVTARLVTSADQWPWSSFRFYHWNDSSVLTMDRVR
jgi:putative transposase